MNYQVGSHIRLLEEKISKLKAELLEYKILHAQAMSHAYSLEDKCAILEQNNAQYMAWFKNHEHIITPRPEPITGPETMYHPVDPK